MKKLVAFLMFALVCLIAGVAMANDVADAGNSFLNFLTEWAPYVAATVAFASVIANLTPNETDNKVVAIINKILGFLAVNFNVKGLLNK